MDATHSTSGHESVRMQSGRAIPTDPAIPTVISPNAIFLSRQFSKVTRPLGRWAGVKLHALLVGVIALTLPFHDPGVTLLIGGLLVAPTFLALGFLEARRSPLWFSPLSFYLFWNSVGLGLSGIYLSCRIFSGLEIPFVVALVSPEDAAAGYVIYLLGSLAVHIGLQLAHPISQESDFTAPPVPGKYAFQWLTALWGESSHGLQYLIEMLQSFRQEIEKTGNIDEDLRMLLVVHFVSDTDKFFPWFWKCSKMVDKATKPANAEDPDTLPREVFPPETCKKIMMILIDVKIEILTERKQIAERNETLAREAGLEAFSLPSDQATNVVLRYAASIDREFYRALNQLERLQRQRNGELLLAPVNLNVTAAM